MTDKKNKFHVITEYDPKEDTKDVYFKAYIDEDGDFRVSAKSESTNWHTVAFISNKSGLTILIPDLPEEIGLELDVDGRIAIS